MGDFFSGLADVGKTLLGPAAELAGGILGSNSQASTNAANLQQNEEFAKMGVQWRVADANAAGLSPLAALGMSSPSFQPVPDTMGDLDHGISESGQDLSRALLSTQAMQDQDAHAMRLKTIEGQDLDNQLKAAQLRKLMSPGSPAPVPLAYLKVKNRDGTFSYVPSHEAASAGFFPASRYNWEAQNFLPGELGPRGFLDDALNVAGHELDLAADNYDF